MAELGFELAPHLGLYLLFCVAIETGNHVAGETREWHGHRGVGGPEPGSPMSPGGAFFQVKRDP